MPSTDGVESCPDPKAALTTILSRYQTAEGDAEVQYLAHLGAKACEVAPVVFCSSDVVDAIVCLFSKSTSEVSTRWLTSWVCSATFRHLDARKLFATDSLRDALCVALVTSSSSDEVRYLASAVCSVTSRLVEARRLFGTMSFLEAMCDAAVHISDADASRWWTCAVCNIVAHDSSNEERFGTSAKFLSVMTSLGKWLTTPLACQWWCATVASVCRTHEGCRWRFTRAATFADVLLPRACGGVESDQEAIRAAGNAWSTLALSPTFRKQHAATLVTVDACCGLALRCRSEASVESVARALCNLTAGSDEAKQLFVDASDMRRALVEMGRVAASSPDPPAATSVPSACLQQYCAALANISSAPRIPPGFVNAALEDVIVQVGTSISNRFSSGTAEGERRTATRWWCRAVQFLCESKSAVLMVSLASEPVVRILASLGPRKENGEHPPTPSDHEYLRAWCSCLRTLATMDETVVCSLDASVVMDLQRSFVNLSPLAASPQAVAALSEACCSVMVTRALAGAFADGCMRKATMLLSTHAHTASSVRWLCTMVSLITSADPAYQELWGCEEGRVRMIALARVLCDVGVLPSAGGTQSAIEAWGTLFCNITSENLFVTTSWAAPAVEESSEVTDDAWSLARSVCELGLRAKSPAALQWICSCFCNLGYFQANEDCQQIWAKEGAIVPRCMVALGRSSADAKDDSALLWFGRALAHVTLQPAVHRFFSDRGACEMLAAVCAATSHSTDAVVSTLCGAICNMCARNVANQAAVVACPSMRGALMRMLRPVSQTDTVVWWLRVLTLLLGRRDSPQWFSDVKSTRYLLSIVKKKLIAGEDALRAFCTVVVLSLRTAADMTTSVLPTAASFGSASPISVSTVEPEALDMLEAILQHLNRDVGHMSENAAEWHQRAVRFVDAHRSAKQPSFLPKDTESITSLPPPTAAAVNAGHLKRRVSFNENVAAYTRLRLSSR